MNLDFKQNFFELFGLDPFFGLDAARLDRAYHELQAKVHPDRFAHLPESRAPLVDAVGDAGQRGLPHAEAAR
ncbi:MAG: hypothetical protein MZW92_25345 [Comamonadaceae bacterium]|nr:hypothetical protein [Comamonadaceae bacterium]